MKRHSPLLAALVLTALSCGISRNRLATYEPYTSELGVLVQDVVVPLEGPTAAVGDTLTIDYEMRVEDRVVDSTVERGRPISFVLGRGQVPLGIEEGLVGMRRLGRRELTIPPSLGYGAEGRPPDIPPGAVLDVRVELLDIRPGNAATTDPE